MYKLKLLILNLPGGRPTQEPLPTGTPSGFSLLFAFVVAAVAGGSKDCVQTRHNQRIKYVFWTYQLSLVPFPLPLWWLELQS